MSGFNFQLYEAIATSAPRTLAGSQGIGLVVVAKGTPEKIRSLATGSGYPTNSDGLPILSMRLVEAECEWVVFSRLIRDTDYTGRTSFLNHVIAVRKQEIFNVFDALGAEEFSPFELALSLPWREPWDHEREVPTESSPMIFDVEQVQRISSSVFDVSCLLAFSSGGGEPPLISPLKAVWLDSKGGRPTPEQIVHRFHQAWAQVDPWRSRERIKNEGRLSEPAVSILDSWDCTFLTQYHTSVRADEFLWIHADRDKRPDLDRQVVGETENNASIVSTAEQRHGEKTVRLLESRVHNPQEWRRGQCELKIRNINHKLEEDLNEIAKVSRDQANSLIETMQNWTVSLKESNGLEQWSEHILTSSTHAKEVRKFQFDFDNIRGAKSVEMSARLEQRRKLLGLLGIFRALAVRESGDCPNNLDAGAESFPPLLNHEYERRFDDALVEAEKCSLLMEIVTKEAKIRERDTQIETEQPTRSALEKELKEFESKNQTLLLENQQLSKKWKSLSSELRETRNKFESQRTLAKRCLVAVLVLLVAAFAIYFFREAPFFGSASHPDRTMNSTNQLSRSDPDIGRVWFLDRNQLVVGDAKKLLFASELVLRNGIPPERSILFLSKGKELNE